jgi:hypothetical protein
MSRILAQAISRMTPPTAQDAPSQSEVFHASYTSYENLSQYKGTKVMKSYQNTLNKLAKAGIKPLSKPALWVNRISGVKREINGVAWPICNLILFVADKRLIGRTFATVDDKDKRLGTLRLTQSDFDNLRHFLNVHESEIYYDFID